jgi:hypothetical protein
VPPFLAAQPLPRSADQRVRSGSYDHTIRLWDASQAAAVRTIYSSKRVVSCIGYSPLAKRLGTPWRVPAQAHASAHPSSFVGGEGGPYDCSRTDIEVAWALCAAE